MLAAFLAAFLAAAAAPAAPLPADTNPAPAGPAPWVVHLKADDAGALQLNVITLLVGKETHPYFEIIAGRKVQKEEVRVVRRVRQKQVALADLTGTIAAADGSPVGRPELLRRVRIGVTVLISADGQAVDRAWLRAVAPTTIVVASEALAGATSPPTGIGVRAAPPPRLTLLAAGPDDTVRVSTAPNAVRHPTASRVAVVNGAQVVFDDAVTYVPFGTATVRPLSEVGFDAYDLTGRLVDRDAAVRRLRAGGLVLLAAGRFPDDAHLRPFRGDVLVLVSSENLTAPGSPAAPERVPAP